MGWYTEPDNYKCKNIKLGIKCGNKFEFTMDTLYIASHGGLPIKCPKCKSDNVTKILKY